MTLFRFSQFLLIKDGSFIVYLNWFSASDDKNSISKPYKIIRVMQEKGSLPSAQLISAKGIEIDPKSEEAESW